VSRPKHPQTLGKIERFWVRCGGSVYSGPCSSIWRMHRRIGWFIDHYNFQRPHQGCDGLTPADRFFSAAPTVLQSLKERVAETPWSWRAMDNRARRFT